MGGNERTHNGGHNSQHTVTPRRGEHVHVGQRKYVRLYDGNEWKLYIYCTLQARQSAHKLDAPPLSRSPPLVRVDAQRAQEGDPAHLVRVGVRVRVRVRA